MRILGLLLIAIGATFWACPRLLADALRGVGYVGEDMSMSEIVHAWRILGSMPYVCIVGVLLFVAGQAAAGRRAR